MCGTRPKIKLRQHVYGHLPAVLRLYLGKHLAGEPRVLQQVAGLRFLAQALISSPRLEGLMGLVDEEAPDDWEWNIPAAMGEDMLLFLERLGSVILSRVSVRPLNTPAALLHWQILAWLVSKLNGAR